MAELLRVASPENALRMWGLIEEVFLDSHLDLMKFLERTVRMFLLGMCVA